MQVGRIDPSLQAPHRLDSRWGLITAQLRSTWKETLVTVRQVPSSPSVAINGFENNFMNTVVCPICDLRPSNRMCGKSKMRKFIITCLSYWHVVSCVLIKPRINFTHLHLTTCEHLHGPDKPVLVFPFGYKPSMGMTPFQRVQQKFNKSWMPGIITIHI